MPFEIVRNDITKMRVDAIVNTANPRPVIGSGTDSMVHAKAGPMLLKARKKVGDIARGDAAITPAFDLDAKYVIHTVGPVWIDGNHGEDQALRDCYEKSLRLAMLNGCESIAFPLISTGNYGFPKDRALQIAISVFSSFLLEQDIMIYLVVFSRQAFRLSEKLFQSVDSYIDQHYVDACERTVQAMNRENRNRRWREAELFEESAVCDTAMMAPCAAPKAMSLEEMLRQADAGFADKLLQLINESGKKKSEIYKKANLTKQHFSKILNNPDYKPTKPTALALAIALELDLDGTKDLIGRAGFALTKSSISDLIVMYHIENRKFNIIEINCVLYDHDQMILGSKDY